jgi:DNA-binding LytR/AlgR family response regulator
MYLDLRRDERNVRFLVGSLRFVAYVLLGPLPAAHARYANSQDVYVNHTASHSALRQRRTHFSHPATLVALLGIASVLAVARPFGTEDNTTTKGEDIALMRLRNAIKEVGATGGMQAHHSHWVANQRTTSASRTSDRAILSMTGGRDISVGRRYVLAIKEAGQLPR